MRARVPLAISAAAVLAVTLTAADEAPRAGAGLPPPMSYEITFKQWVPQSEFVDTDMPAPLDYRYTRAPSDLAAVDPNCLPDSKELEHTQVSSAYAGNAHRGFGGTSWVSEVISFSFNGEISGFRVVAKNGGRWTRKKVYTRDGKVIARCQTQKDTPFAGFAHKTAVNKFEMQLAASNPLAGGARAGTSPAVLSEASGTVQPNGDIELKLDLEPFPSTGILVQDNGKTILTDIGVDASCLKKNLVLGYEAVGTIIFSSLDDTTENVTASPTSPKSTSRPSLFCH